MWQMDDKSIVSPEGKKKVSKKDIFTTSLESLYAKGISQNQEKILQKMQDTELVAKTSENKFKVCFRFASRSVKECLLKHGNVLELFSYYTLLLKGCFDDVKANVQFCWDSSEEDDYKKMGAITNEIDLVCTKGVQTYFISCKQSELKKEFLTEIKYYADYFGIDAKPIILCSHWKMDKNSGAYEKTYLTNRSKSMGVYVVNRECIGKNEEMIRKGNLAKVLKNIAEGKKDWENV